MISTKNKIDLIQDSIKSFHELEPISYLVLDDFIDEDIFEECQQSIVQSWFNILQQDEGNNRKNKTIFIPGEVLSNLYDYFSSQEFIEYLSKIFWSECCREFSISQEQIRQRCWEKWLIWQLYEGSDSFGWHVDGYDKWISLWAFTYYLGWYNGDWKKEYWGVLELWKGNWENITPYKNIIPKKNRIVFMVYSESAYHRVTSNSSAFPRISLQSTIIKK